MTQSISFYWAIHFWANIIKTICSGERKEDGAKLIEVDSLKIQCQDLLKLNVSITEDKLRLQARIEQLEKDAEIKLDNINKLNREVGIYF